jgi:vacuolar-type H+-ATPase subunit E/Vma4
VNEEEEVVDVITTDNDESNIQAIAADCLVNVDDDEEVVVINVENEDFDEEGRSTDFFDEGSATTTTATPSEVRTNGLFCRTKIKIKVII